MTATLLLTKQCTIPSKKEAFDIGRRGAGCGMAMTTTIGGIVGDVPQIHNQFLWETHLDVLLFGIMKAVFGHKI